MPTPLRYVLGAGLFYGIILWGLYHLRLALALPTHLPAMLRGILAGAYLRRFEEWRLAADFGPDFEAYRAAVPMFFPLPRRRGRAEWNP